MLANDFQSRGRKPSIPKIKNTGGHELGQAEPWQKRKTLDCLDLCSVFSLCTNQLILSGKQKESETKKQTYKCARKSTPDQLTRWMTSSGCWTSPKPNFLICMSLGHRWSGDTRHKVNSKSLAKTGCSTVLGGRYYISWWWQSSQSQQAWTLFVIRLLWQSAAACDTKDGAHRMRKIIRPSHRVQARLVTHTVSRVWLWAIHLPSCCSLWVLIWKWKHPLCLLQRLNPVEPGKCLTHSLAPRKWSACHH